MMSGWPLRRPLRSGLGRSLALPLSRGVPDFGDLRAGMPAGSTYTRPDSAPNLATGLRLDGTLARFSINEPQRTDRGLVLEPAATNHLRYSQGFDNASWSKTGANVSANSAPAPDGTTTADTLVEDTSSGFHQILQTYAAASVSDKVSFSTFFKAAGRSKIEFGGNWGFSQIIVDLTTGAITGSGASKAEAMPFADDVWRVTFTDFPPDTVTRSYVARLHDGASDSYMGDGASGVITWQADLTISDAAMSPIFTEGAAATRGLPVMDWPVPSGRSRILLTFADASELLVEGLTPGGTFDVVTPVLAAGKGRFGVSEMVDWEWRA